MAGDNKTPYFAQGPVRGDKGEREDPKELIKALRNTGERTGPEKEINEEGK